jgi:hypothetical protein
MDLAKWGALSADHRLSIRGSRYTCRGLPQCSNAPFLLQLLPFKTTMNLHSVVVRPIDKATLGTINEIEIYAK